MGPWPTVRLKAISGCSASHPDFLVRYAVVGDQKDRDFPEECLLRVARPN